MFQKLNPSMRLSTGGINFTDISFKKFPDKKLAKLFCYLNAKTNSCANDVAFCSFNLISILHNAGVQKNTVTTNNA